MAFLRRHERKSTPANSKLSSWRLFWLRLRLALSLHHYRSKKVEEMPPFQFYNSDFTTTKDADEDSSDDTAGPAAPVTHVRVGRTILTRDDSMYSFVESAESAYMRLQTGCEQGMRCDEDEDDNGCVSFISVLTMDPALSLDASRGMRRSTAPVAFVEDKDGFSFRTIDSSTFLEHFYNSTLKTNPCRTWPCR